MADEIKWIGASGRSYTYWVHPMNTAFKAEPGNYCMAKETQPGRFVPLYFGETSDLSERFDNHHKMSCFTRNGATHIHAHTNSAGQDARLAEEVDLIRKWNPSCNG
jgi:predicted GIY-YIG superfamily endonuclease